ncbi:RNA chaperone Hfq [Paenibacillus sp. Leaf72]|uniref:RNA chaperone Hfq n=1 Tax=Paenibacillus sp. Leaf72 TaxID=1736234 RepID=UPI0006FA7E97|nr:RNA chaperone Hfq [Paenibacillus sp. Leaf72]KQN96952.1 hypothetical protein ASF12_23060 [Paenibacillus sp. Leaf72]
MKHNKINFQDIFLNQCRKDKTVITLFLNNGVPMTGTIVHFDTFSIIMNADGKQSFVYKHAIATINPTTPVCVPHDDKLYADDKQDTFLSQCRKSKVTIDVFLVNGKKLQGKISHVDNYSILLNASNGKQHFLFKHAISTMIPDRAVTLAPAKSKKG